MEDKGRFTFKKVLTFILDIIYYFILMLILFLLLISMKEDSDHRTINGYSSFYIETNSMASVYPRGSMIITKEKTANELEVGDDVTYYDISNTQAMVTHRIIDKVTENGDIYFQTQGVDNEKPDKFLVPIENIVGQVVWSMPQLGIYMSYLRENIVFVLVLIVLLVLFIKSFSNYLSLRKET